MLTSSPVRSFQITTGNQQWRDYARIFLTAVFRQFNRFGEVAISHVAALEHIARQRGGDNLGIRDWIRGGKLCRTGRAK